MVGRSWFAVVALVALQAPHLAQGLEVDAQVGVAGAKTSPDIFGTWQATPALIPTTTSTKSHIYLTDCAGSLTYSLDAGITVSLGTFVAGDSPYVLAQGLDDGTHTLTFTCAAGTPVTYTWMVDTSDSISISFTQATPDLTNTETTMLYLTASQSIGANVDTVTWYASEVLNGAATNFVAYATCANSQTCTYTSTMGSGDGKYTYKFKAVYLYNSASDAAYPTDLGVKTSSVKGTSVTLVGTRSLFQLPALPNPYLAPLAKLTKVGY